MTDNRITWANTPGLLAMMEQCISEKLSAGQTSKEISRIAGYTISRNAMIGAAKRRGLKFHSELNGKNKSPRKTIRLRRVRQRKPPSIPMPVEQEIPDDFLGITILDLPLNGCRFPNGTGPYLFCGQPQWNSSSYCRHHHQICNAGFSVFKKPGESHEFYGSPGRHMQNSAGRKSSST